nr:translocation/assembly module TamB domain-containing protein [Desulforhopalus vacuolatus]
MLGFLPRRRTSRLLVLLLLLFLCFVGAVLSPLGVQGVRFAANSFSGGQVHIGQASGAFFNSFTFADISVKGEGKPTTLKKFLICWKPFALLRGKLHLEQVEVDGLFVDGSIHNSEQKEPAKSSFQPQKLLSLFSVQVDDFSASDVVFDRGFDKDGDPCTSFLFDSVHLAFSGGLDGVRIQKLKLDGPDMALDMKGSLEPGTLPATDWQVDFGGFFRFAGFGFHSMTGNLQLSGDAENPDLAAVLFTPGTLSANVKVHDLTSDPHWAGRLRGHDFDLSAWIKYCPSIIFSNVDGDVKGDFHHYEGHAVFTADWEHRKNLRLEGDFNGNADKIDLSDMRLQQGESQVTAESIWLYWKEGFAWRGDLHGKKIDPQLIVSQLAGRLDGRFETRLKTSGKILNHLVVGEVNIAELDGEIDNQPVWLSGDIQLDNESVSSDKLLLRSGEMDGEAVVGPARFTWEGDGGWQGKILLKKFNPGFFSPLFEGTVDGELESSGQLSSSSTPSEKSADGDHRRSLQTKLRLKELSGTIHGNKLSGSGEISFANGVLLTDGFSLALGRSQLHLARGNVATDSESGKLRLKGSFSSPDIGDFLPRAQGSLQLSMDGSGTLARPEIQAKFSGRGLSRDEFFLGSVDGNIRLEGVEKSLVSGTLRAMELKNGRNRIGGLDADLTGRVDSHTLSVRLTEGNFGESSFSSSLSVKGGYSLAEKRWKGVLNGGRLELPQEKVLPRLIQQDEAQLSLGREGVSLSSFCLTGAPGELCISGEVDSGREKVQAGEVQGPRWQTSLDIAKLDLGILSKGRNPLLLLTGLLSGTAQFSGTGSVPQNGQFALELPRAKLEFNDGMADGETFVLDNTRFDGSFTAGELRLAGNSDVGNNGLFTFNVNADGIDDIGTLPKLATLPLSGTLSLSNLKVDMLGALLPEGQPVGRLYAEFDLSGTARDPMLKGDARLDGSVGVLSRGIVLTDVGFSVSADRNSMRMDGRARSGRGEVKVGGRLEYQPVFFGMFAITGKDFTAVSQPEYTFEVNPDLHFQFNAKGGRLSGKVAVASGEVDLNNFTPSVSASEDVVLVNKNGAEKTGWPISLDVDVALQDAVKVKGYGLSGMLSGNLVVHREPEDVFTGKGLLQLKKAKISMYGRTLDITRGNITFSGGPIDNPGIDVRAQKTMTDEQTLGEGYTVGIDVSGLVQSLQYHLFSSPSMTETEILSYLILGHSLAGAESGDESLLVTVADKLGLAGGSLLFGDLGSIFSIDDVHLEGSASKENISLVVGKRLSRDVYVGYDVNMFSQVGEFWIRYNMKHGFSVETHSSSESTGADILFSFEK